MKVVFFSTWIRRKIGICWNIPFDCNLVIRVVWLRYQLDLSQSWQMIEKTEIITVKNHITLKLDKTMKRKKENRVAIYHRMISYIIGKISISSWSTVSVPFAAWFEVRFLLFCDDAEVNTFFSIGLTFNVYIQMRRKNDYPNWMSMLWYNYWNTFQFLFFSFRCPKIAFSWIVYSTWMSMDSQRSKFFVVGFFMWVVLWYTL